MRRPIPLGNWPFILEEGNIKERIDTLLVKKALVPTRARARSLIMSGVVFVDGTRVDKEGTLVEENSRVELKDSSLKYVGRGGIKLESALREFSIDVRDKVALDVGASTGGFTDCLLKHGAKRVYAVDVGYGQLDWKLRQDPRVVVKERVNARAISPELLYAAGSKRADLAVIDVSFISLAKVLPACLSCLDSQDPEIICLVKPQFEAGREAVGKGGVVRDPAAHVRVLESVLGRAAALGLQPHGLTFSPLTGPAGNIEYLVDWQARGSAQRFDPTSLVGQAFETLKRR